MRFFTFIGLCQTILLLIGAQRATAQHEICLPALFAHTQGQVRFLSDSTTQNPIVPPAVGSVRVYVNGEMGADTNMGTQGAPFKTMRKAISAAVAADTVVVQGITPWYRSSPADEPTHDLVVCGSADAVLGAFDAPPTWAVSHDGLFATPIVGIQTDSVSFVVDISRSLVAPPLNIPHGFGDLARVYSRQTCVATPFSFFRNSDTLLVNTNGAQPSQKLVLVRSSQHTYGNKTGGNLTILYKNIVHIGGFLLFGGNTSHNITNFQDCTLMYSGNIGYGVVAAQLGQKLYVSRCYIARAAGDVVATTTMVGQAAVLSFITESFIAESGWRTTWQSAPQYGNQHQLLTTHIADTMLVFGCSLQKSCGQAIALTGNGCSFVGNVAIAGAKSDFYKYEESITPFNSGLSSAIIVGGYTSSNPGIGQTAYLYHINAPSVAPFVRYSAVQDGLYDTGLEASNSTVYIDSIYMGMPLVDIFANSANFIYGAQYVDTFSLHCPFMPVSTHTSIADFAELLLYPTPAANDLTIAWAAAQNTLLDICVSNLMGQPCLHTQKMVEAGQNATTISLAPLVAGAYTLTLTTQNGQRVVRKVLKI